jgi:hypothetical protein
MKDLLFGAVDNYTWNQIKPWAQSIRDSGFDGKVVLLVYRGDVDAIATECSELDIEVFTANYDNWGKAIDHNAGGRDTQSHQMRFFHMWHYLRDCVDKLRYVIATDVRDVIFQRNPSEWLENNIMSGWHVVAPSEGIRYDNESWGASNLQSGFGPFVWLAASHYEIFNVGTIAAPAPLMRELALFLYSMGEGRFIPNDQSSFNLLVNGGMISVDKVRHDDGWACQCGTMADPEKIEAFRPHLLSPEPVFDEDGYAFTSTGEKFYLLHQWDRVPSIVGKIEARYA